MKTALAIVLSSLILLGLRMETHYIRPGVVTMIERNGTIICADAQNREWAFEVDSLKEFHKGQKIQMEMVTNGTDSIYDDAVVGYRL